MMNAYRQWRQYRRLLKNRSHDDYQVKRVSEAAYIAAARRLHAAVYMDRGYVGPEAITKTGQLRVSHDPYQRHADYFVAFSQIGGQLAVVATARQIIARRDHGHNSFPMYRHLQLYALQRHRIAQMDPSQCVEISALARRRGESAVLALLLYRAMWRHSLAAGHKQWLMACDIVLYRRLRQLFGPAVEQAGPPAFYMGSRVVPAIINVADSLAWVQRVSNNRNPLRNRLRWQVARFLLEPEEEVPTE